MSTLPLDTGTCRGWSEGAAGQAIFAPPSRGAFAEFRGRVSNRLSKHFARTPFTLRNDRPLVTFTFDDVPETALTHGATLLRQAGIAGTFYLAAGLLGRRTPDWTVIGADGVRALREAGHEIGCHTYSHAEAPYLDDAAVLAEVERNRAGLAEIVPSLRLENFAFPYGTGSMASKRALAGRFRSSRGIVPGINVGEVDLQLLKAYPLVDALLSRDVIDRVFDVALARTGWVIFYTHDVSDWPSPFGCRPELLAYAIEAAAKRGIAGVTISEGLDRSGHPRPA